MMFALRAISIFCCAVFFVPFSQAVQSPEWLCYRSFVANPQSRIEDRTDSKIEAKENSKKNRKPSKPIVWNLDGGVFFATDGHLPNGSCFRLSGQMTAPDFFDGLRRVGTDGGSVFTRHDKTVTAYPSELSLIVHLRDFPCAFDLQDSTVRPPLTPELMSTLHLNFFWKDGVDLRPIDSSRRTDASMRRLESFATGAAADELAPRFEFSYSFTVDSDGVPLTNDLVLIIEGQDHKIAARVAARL